MASTACASLLTGLLLRHASGLQRRKGRSKRRITAAAHADRTGHDVPVTLWQSSVPVAPLSRTLTTVMRTLIAVIQCPYFDYQYS